jgi:hypothetical protein
MADSHILANLQLSDADATDLIQKFLAFYNGLNQAQQAAFLNYEFATDFVEAASVMTPNVTPDDLLNFIQSRSCGPPPTILVGIRTGDEDSSD